MRKEGFDVVVLCAKEYSQRKAMLRGAEVIDVPLDDSGPPPTLMELSMAKAASKRLFSLHRRGARILVTCWQGRNRSGLVTALTLREVTGVSGRRARVAVQSVRENALVNQYFADYLDKLPRKSDLSFITL